MKMKIKIFRGFIIFDNNESNSNNWSINIDKAVTIVWRDWDVLGSEDGEPTEENAALTMYFPFMLDEDGKPEEVDMDYSYHDDGKTIAYTQVIISSTLAVEIRKALEV